jgi:Fe2+ transport system protein FeoA
MNSVDCAQPGLQANCFCSLSQVRLGTAVRIKQLRASDDVSQRLREIGFCEEQVIKPLINQSTIICQVCNSRLGISAQLAEMILVEPVFRRAA